MSSSNWVLRCKQRDGAYFHSSSSRFGIALQEEEEEEEEDQDIIQLDLLLVEDCKYHHSSQKAE